MCKINLIWLFLHDIVYDFNIFIELFKHLYKLIQFSNIEN